jgi:hypothetical protein
MRPPITARPGDGGAGAPVAKVCLGWDVWLWAGLAAVANREGGYSRTGGKGVCDGDPVSRSRARRGGVGRCRQLSSR